MSNGSCCKSVEFIFLKDGATYPEEGIYGHVITSVVKM